MKNVRVFYIVAISLLFIQLVGSNFGVLADISAENEGKINVSFISNQDDLLTWHVDVNEMMQEHEELSIEILFDDTQTHGKIIVDEQIASEEIANGYLLTVPASTNHHEIGLHTNIKEISSNATVKVIILDDDVSYEASAQITEINDLESQTELVEAEHPEDVEKLVAQDDEVKLETVNETSDNAGEETVTAYGNINVAPESDFTIMAAGDNITPLEYDKTNYSKNVRNYNGIIFGDHYINGGDNEGSTAVGGNIVIEGSFDYGAAEIGHDPGTIIGSAPLHRDTPGLLLGGKITGSGSGIGIYNGVVMEENADPNNSLLIKKGGRVFVPQAELDYVFAGFRTYIDNHMTNLQTFITSSTTPDLQLVESALNDKVLIANITGANYNVGSPQFSDFDDYEKVIIYSDATSINFSNGSIFYDGQNVNTSAPFGSDLNFEKVATKVTWLFPNAQTITSGGYGVVGTVIAPNANYTGNGGSLNGQLFIHDLKSYGGFELHQFRNKVEEPSPGYGQIKITKVDADDTAINLAGAKFTIVDVDDDIVGVLETDINGEALSEELPIGDYRLIEIEAPEDYEIEDSEIPVTVLKDEVTEIVIENTRIPAPLGEIKLIKVSASDNDERLADAEFVLRDESGTEIATGHTNNQGELHFTDLVLGKYFLTEIKAPEGYRILTGEIELELTKQNTTIEHVVENEEIDWVIPDTGGIGTVVFYGIGLVLIALALWFLLRRRKV